jgi:hypothetical protein
MKKLYNFNVTYNGGFACSPCKNVHRITTLIPLFHRATSNKNVVPCNGLPGEE